MRLGRLKEDIRRWGCARAVFARAMAVAARHTGLRVYRVNLRLLSRNAPAPELSSGLALRVATAEELKQAAGDPELDMQPQFVGDALARGDMAFGAFEGDRLVGYTWRTFTYAPHIDGLWVGIDRPFQYSYKGFTRPSHRRRGIHAAITHFADAYLIERGYAAEVGFVDVTNFASLAVADSMGRRKIGCAGHVSWLGGKASFRTAAVKKIGIVLFERGAEAFYEKLRRRQASLKGR
jgi:GNAT superfamily N-acetyltransferase